MRIKKKFISKQNKQQKKKLLKNPELTLLTRHRNNQIERKQKKITKFKGKLFHAK